MCTLIPPESVRWFPVLAGFVALTWRLGPGTQDGAAGRRDPWMQPAASRTAGGPLPQVLEGPIFSPGAPRSRMSSCH
jgi:hypothetical protein